MDSDATYRMIVSFGFFVIGAIVVGISWPLKKRQNHYDSPLLRTQPRKVEEPLIIIESPVIEPSDDSVEEEEEEEEECLICQWYDDSEMVNIIKFIERFYGQVDNQALAETVCLSYNQNIYKEGMPKLEYANVIGHIEGNHMTNDEAFAGVYGCVDCDGTTLPEEL